MKLKEFIEILQDESFDQESEVNYAIVYNPDKNTLNLRWKQMNKQEAIERIKNIDTLNINDRVAGQQVDMVIKNEVLNIISQIDEPQKPVIPKFVAEWIKSKKESFSDMSAIYMYDNLTLDNNGGHYHEVWLWAIAHHHDFIKA